MSAKTLPPQSIEAEEALLSAILLRPDILPDLKAFVVPSDLVKPAHQWALEAIYSLHDRGLPIDPTSVANEPGPDGKMSYADLRELWNEPTSSTSWRRYADIVVDCSRRRRLIYSLSETTQAVYDTTKTVDEVLADYDPVEADHLIASRGTEVAGLASMQDFVATANMPVNHREWLIPGMVRRMWRVVLAGEEGAGKFVFLRQLALHAAAGRDPFDPRRYFTPIRVLTVDAENADSTIVHQTKLVNTSPSIDLLAEAEDRSHIWHREGGVDLRSRRGRAEFEAAIQKTRPDLIIAGPLYKLVRRRKGDDVDEAPLEFCGMIDDLRMRYRFAIILEAHMAKSNSGSYRTSDPKGSGVWMQWPEIGRALRSDGDAGVYELEKFRGDREPCDWPKRLHRKTLLNSQPTAWGGEWPDGRWAENET
jgi:replicative DNA helicase